MPQHTHSILALVATGTLLSSGFALAQNPPPSNPNTPPTRQQPPARPRTPDAAPGDLHAGYMETPKYAQQLQGSLGENTIEIHDEADFKGEQTTLSNVSGGHAAGTLNAYPEKFDDAATSLRWNLAPGVLVVMFDDDAGKGEQLALWGKGQIPDLKTCDYNNQATRWAWYDIGGGLDTRSADAILMPQGAQALAGSSDSDFVQIFDDQDFKDDQQNIMHVTGSPAGTWLELPGAPGLTGEKENAASSIRWNLPEGVIVLLSAKDNGNKDIVLFGKGEYSDLAQCNFNNSASRWAWAYIGTAKKMNGDHAGDDHAPAPNSRDPNRDHNHN